ncbi:MAG: YicC/YloC family endoribonuclease [Anaerovoracaceae bacterium]
MIKSMTGFGKGEFTDSKRNITVEMKSVNHRYVDIHVKMPRRYAFAEEQIKSLIKETVKRGKVEISVMVENLTEEDVKVRLNHMVAKQYLENLTELKELFSLKDEVTLQYLASLPDVMKSVPDVESEEEIRETIAAAVSMAIKNFDNMRITEGEKLGEDLLMRGDLIRDYVKKIELKAPLVGEIYAKKLKDRISDLLANNVEIPEDRILMEAAIFADKANVTEELVRLDSHIIQLNNIIKKGTKSEGKKLDFLVQEMNRETNTIGSKANDLEVTETVLEIKSEVEKIREQVQNIE